MDVLRSATFSIMAAMKKNKRGRPVGRPKASAMKGTAKSRARKVGKTRDALYKRGKVDRGVLKANTQMTKEKWQKLQEGMAEKWPLPAYMGGEKGHLQFRDETFALITRWMHETPIEYRPHAKSPGSKSHLRYERYSKAKTVGEALKLGSYPVDWCWDYERGFIKVKRGPVRDEPLDISKDDQVSEVDKAINTWYIRELSKMLGMSPKDLAASVGALESLHMRAMRLLAQREASERLEAADREGRAVTDEEVLLTLKRWPFFKNPWRKNVMQKGKTWVFSDSLGVLRDRQGDIHLTAPTRRYPQVSELLARWLTDRLPPEAKEFCWTSINVNCNYAGACHRDNGNFGPSFIKAFGDFTGGELNYWPEDDGGDLSMLSKSDKLTLDIRNGLALFNGNCAHSVQSFEGSRYSLVYFTVACHAGVRGEDRAKLQQLGFNVPAVDQDPFQLLRPPKGFERKQKADTSKKGMLPALRYYSNKAIKLVKRRPKAAAEVKKLAARRLQPENARSFYSSKQRRVRWSEKQELDEYQ